LRKFRGFSQVELAEKCEVTVEHISGIERGSRAPSLEILEKLALALRVTISDLFDFEKLTPLSGSEASLQLFIKHARNLPPADIRALTQVAKRLKGKSFSP
jgi:transcriptional regulator with XRE-family HTH domain